LFRPGKPKGAPEEEAVPAAPAFPEPEATAAPVLPEPITPEPVAPAPPATATPEAEEAPSPEATAPPAEDGARAPEVVATPVPIPTEPLEVSPEPKPPEAEPTEVTRPGGEPTPVEREPAPTPSLDVDLRAARPPEEGGAAAQEQEGKPGEREIELPGEEIHGELEKPEIFFLLPRARDRSDEQMIRSRIRREIVRPLIKDWLEEELLLK
jgi:hypothetical protein